MTSPASLSAGPQFGACPVCETAARGPFCHRCGAKLSAATAASARSRWIPWLLGGCFVALLAVALLRGGRSMPPATATSSTREPRPEGPDIDALTPAERFGRLYQKVIAAAQQGDQATVARFTPMAVAAYQALDTITVDARYHLAMLQMHVGNLTGAEAQADTIRMHEPKHLFGYVIGAAVARWTKQDSVQQRFHREFASRYEGEVATGRPEYLEHKAMLAEVRKAATGPRD